MTKRLNNKEATGLAHELWAAGQLRPGEGIEDGVARIEAVLKESQSSPEPKSERFIKVSYDGGYPTSCMGTLTIKVDGEVVYDKKYVCVSSGSVSFDDDWNEEVAEGTLTWKEDEASKFDQEIQDAVAEVLGKVHEKVMRGFVNFPMNDPKWDNSGEGGMFVQLVVIPSSKDNFEQCCGTRAISIHYTESFIGDDKRKNRDVNDESLLKCICRGNVVSAKCPFKGHLGQRFPLVEYYFPHGIEEPSVPMYASITLGSTGWSGYNERKGYWRCTYADLTVEGKQLYYQMKKLYPKTIIRLLTWLDT